MTCYLCGYPESDRRPPAEWERRDGIDVCGPCVRLHLEPAEAVRARPTRYVVGLDWGKVP